MFRKMLVIAAAVAMPASALAGASAIAASSGAGASGALTVTPVTCIVGGNVAFGTGGITEGATVSTATTTTSTSTLTHVVAGSSAGCQTAAQVTHITQATQKCNAPTTLAPLPASAGALVGLTPGFTVFPLCTAHPTDSEQGSAWGFLGGVKKGAAYVSTTGGIKTALKAGVKFKDGTTTLTLTVTTVTSSNPTSPGAACGTSDPGFVLSGTVKGATTHHWSSDICLSTDTVTGGTAGGFLTDLLTLVTATHNDSTPTSLLHITKATVDPTVSKLVIT